MKRSTKIIGAVVLSISLVTAAGAYATYKHGNGEAHAAFITSYISSELGLDDTQQLQLTALSEQVMSLKDQFKAQGQPLHQELEKLLSADTFDQQKALNMISDTRPLPRLSLHLPAFSMGSILSKRLKLWNL